MKTAFAGLIIVSGITLGVDAAVEDMPEGLDELRKEYSVCLARAFDSQADTRNGPLIGKRVKQTKRQCADKRRQIVSLFPSSKRKEVISEISRLERNHLNARFRHEKRVRDSGRKTKRAGE